MTEKPKLTPKLTDDERLERFKEMAREVGASQEPVDFDKAFEKVVIISTPKDLS